MAKFDLELPTEIIKDIKKISDNSDKIFEEMTKAGAEVVKSNIKANIPSGIQNSEMMKCLKITKSYRTIYDDAINTKIAFFGYFRNKDGKRVPAPLVASVFEHGRSGLSFPKHPFLRKSFKKSEIEKAMLRVQNKYIKE